MRRAITALVLCLMPAMAAAAATLDLDQVAGVYKYRFANGLMDGTKFTSEDILEVVKIAPGKAYVRTHLEFFNGHICGLAAMMRVEGDALVWRATNLLKQPCELRLRFAGGKVSFDDKDGRCRVDSCGMRGAYNGVSFPTASRRAIRYMPRLLASPQYRDAVKAGGL